MQARVSLAAAAFLVLASILASLAHAQDYPSHPIKLVLPQPPGGIIDLISRSLGERLSDQMKQPVIVENMPGANGSLAAGQVARSVPDGYTLFMAVDTNSRQSACSRRCRSCSLRIPRCRPTTCAS
jgi:tripartite-type tricarboxylate transporter receptor subunit TctC